MTNEKKINVYEFFFRLLLLHCHLYFRRICLFSVYVDESTSIEHPPYMLPPTHYIGGEGDFIDSNALCIRNLCREDMYIPPPFIQYHSHMYRIVSATLPVRTSCILARIYNYNFKCKMWLKMLLVPVDWFFGHSLL